MKNKLFSRKKPTISDKPFTDPEVLYAGSNSSEGIKKKSGYSLLRLNNTASFKKNVSPPFSSLKTSLLLSKIPFIKKVSSIKYKDTESAGSSSFPLSRKKDQLDVLSHTGIDPKNIYIAFIIAGNLLVMLILLLAYLML